VSQASSEGQPLHPARQASGAMPAGGVQQAGRDGSGKKIDKFLKVDKFGQPEPK